MLYRDFPWWAKLLTVVITVAILWGIWFAVSALVDRLSDSGVYVLVGLGAVAIAGLFVADRVIVRRRKARRQGGAGSESDIR
jgi:hypothetical protein